METLTMDGLDYSTLLREGGWLIFILYIAIRDLIPRLLDSWDRRANQAETSRAEGARFAYSLTEKQIHSWEKIADKLERVAIALARVEELLSSQQRTLSSLLNSQTVVLERLGLHRHLSQDLSELDE